MLSRFFINRPILASVISLLIMAAGGVAIFSLPISQFPEIAPPMVQVTASYPGADPKVVADTVAAPIEQQVNGVENMIYMQSTSASDGSYTLKVTFELGTDVDMATVLVQNRVNWAMASLPQDVQRQGIITKKASTSFVTVLCLYSPDGSYDDLFLTNYVTTTIKDQVSRLHGVGDVVMYPTKDYSMRVWLNPNRLQYNSLTTNDVVGALKSQNVQVAAGRLGQEPAPKGQVSDLPVNTLGRLTEVGQFEDIVVKTGKDGSIVRIRDLGKVELGAKSYDTRSYYNGAPAVTLIVYQTPGSNALDVADEVHRTMENLKKDFPKGVDYKIVYESSNFIRASIKEVVITLIEAFILVFIVVFIFLQDWRATLVPATTVPVSIVGAFAIMYMMGFSINMLTMFGLVLAIGIVVDDAIVVVENVDRNMTQYGLSPKEASIKAMEEITGAIIGITLVLMAVFIPAAFLGGIAGQLYRQFSLTIAVTTLLSAVNAMTLKPVQCSLWLRPHKGEKNAFYRAFDAVFDKITGRYTAIVSFLVRNVPIMVLIWATAIGLTYYAFTKVPTGFLPDEDDGLILLNAQLPDGASLQRTDATMKKVSDLLRSTDGIAHYSIIPGTSILDGNGPTLGSGFASLEPWDERLKKGRTKEVILAELAAKFTHIQDGIVFPFSLPPIVGLGQSAGSEMWLQDRSGAGLTRLNQAANDMLKEAYAEGQLRAFNSTFRASAPTIFADVDRVKALSLKVPLQSLFDTLQAYLGSTYVNDFNEFGRTWHVTVQADAKYRAGVDDIKKLEVRNQEGNMVPIGTMVKLDYAPGPLRIDRYNMFPAIRVIGEGADGVSSGQVMREMENLAEANLPPGTGYEWTGVAYQQQKIGGQIYFVFAMAVLVVLMILAAQYESWIDPIAVIAVVPLAVLGAVVGLALRGLDNSLYTQVGLVLLVGLSAKNAILVVEFAREKQAGGMTAIEAAVEGAKLRFRAIIMTSFAFIVGVLPLVIATGAGAASRRAVGTAVCFGMLGVTMLGVFFTPPMYVLVQKFKKRSPVPSDAPLVQHHGT
ncbi:MAG: multidrug efflux RND transporter permease subunit [Desulfomonile tiedjei]|uniref:Multidrug efflux RND transporter permease subunit n=1 Tax=Desulfomonile tiedjei TaxID=2358 RepID=A0A9D6V2Q9_9BACT|nr:multidrug efflux RND transporter permease subunit [Desulfomonile tiedjei]